MSRKGDKAHPWLLERNLPQRFLQKIFGVISPSTGKPISWFHVLHGYAKQEDLYLDQWLRSPPPLIDFIRGSILGGDLFTTHAKNLTFTVKNIEVI